MHVAHIPDKRIQQNAQFWKAHHYIIIFKPLKPNLNIVTIYNNRIFNEKECNAFQLYHNLSCWTWAVSYKFLSCALINLCLNSLAQYVYLEISGDMNKIDMNIFLVSWHSSFPAMLFQWNIYTETQTHTSSVKLNKSHIFSFFRSVEQAVIYFIFYFDHLS